MSDLLTEKFDKRDLEGRIVLMGYVGPTQDVFYMDEDGSKKINGVEVQANFIDHLINR